MLEFETELPATILRIEETPGFGELEDMMFASAKIDASIVFYRLKEDGYTLKQITCFEKDGWITLSGFGYRPHKENP